jgi:hypothetical protein
MEELELAPLDVALAVGDEGEHSLLGDVVVGAVGGFVVALLELGALERRRVTHGAAADGLLERRGRGWNGMRVCQSGRVGLLALPGNATART